MKEGRKEGMKRRMNKWELAIKQMSVNWYSRINDCLCYYYFDLFGAWWMAHQYRYLEQDGSFSWTDYILFSRVAVPLCVQEICFSHASLGLQKKKKKDELAVEIFFGVRDSDGQDRCIWQNKVRRRAIWLIQILFYLHLKPQSHFQKHFGRNLLVRELLSHKR